MVSSYALADSGVDFVDEKISFQVVGGRHFTCYRAIVDNKKAVT